MTEKGIMTKLT